MYLKAFLLMLVCFSATANNWHLDKNFSKLNFTTVKNNAIGENHQFRQFDMLVKSDGSFEVTINLDSVDTAIEIRDQRIKQHVFKTDKKVIATLKGEVDLNAFLESKQALSSLSTTATLLLAGHKTEILVEITAQRVNAETMRIVSSSPVLLSAKKLKLVEGFDKLQELAGLQSIDYIVPVTFDFTLKKVVSI